MKITQTRIAALVICVFALALVGSSSPGVTAGGGAPEGDVTFSKHIAPILQRSCQNCHRPGSIAPMSLLTYQDARPWARAIKQKTSQREMPPWFIEKNVGVQGFKDDPSLSDDEIETIGKWVDSGAPQGNPADMPPARVFESGNDWTIGKPDLVLSSDEHLVQGTAADAYEFLSDTPTGLAEDRYVKAIEFREVRLDNEVAKTTKNADDRAALNLFVIHHAIIGSTDGRDPNSGAPGARAAQREGDDVASLGSRFNLVWELGQNATIYPDDAGIKLAANSALTWNLHLHSVGRPQRFRVDAAFKLQPKGYKPKYVNMGGLPGGGQDLDIPAGERSARFDNFGVMPRNGKIITFEPHMHSSGSRFCYEVQYPDGKRETINCAGYNHNWVKVYMYKDEVAPLIPAGSIVHFTGWYDNTAKNPRVVDPRNWKAWDGRSIGDMFLMLNRVIYLTDEQYKEELAARQGVQRQTALNQQ